MTSDRLKLHTNKTELMFVAPKVLLQKVGDLLLSADGSWISPSSVRILGVTLDSLTFEDFLAPCIPTLQPVTEHSKTGEHMLCLSYVALGLNYPK